MEFKVVSSFLKHKVFYLRTKYNPDLVDKIKQTARSLRLKYAWDRGKKAWRIECDWVFFYLFLSKLFETCSKDELNCIYDDNYFLFKETLDVLRKVGLYRKEERKEENGKNKRKLLVKRNDSDQFGLIWSILGQLRDYLKCENFSKMANKLTNKIMKDSRLYEYQRVGIAGALIKILAWGGVLIGDEMGLGKTVQAIMLYDLLKEAGLVKNVLVVCPSSLKLNWQEEFKKWANKESVVLTCRNFDSVDVEKEEVVIVNYENLSKFVDRGWKFDLVIFDESHYVKNLKAQRTKNAIELASRAKYRILLTGTPMANHAWELYSQLKIVYPDFMSYSQFCFNFCEVEDVELRDRTVRRFFGFKNQDDLKKVFEIFSIRRVKEDVLEELPQKQRVLIKVDSSTELNKISAQILNEIESLKNLKELSKEEFDVRKRVIFEKIEQFRQRAWHEKKEQVKEFIKDVLEQEKKVVVFVWHREAIEYLKEELKEYNPVCLHGGVSAEERQEVVKRFQEEDNCRVCIASFKVAGLGFTLTSASIAAFCEFDWNPATIVQAEDRLHRISQKSSVTYYYLVCSETIDELIIRTVLEKIESLRDVTGQEFSLLSLI